MGVVVDQAWIDADPITADSLWKQMGSCAIICANFAIQGLPRVVRDIRAAVTRRDHEQLYANRAAQMALRSELTGPISGILLSSELALAQPALPSAVADKLRSVHQLALQIKSRLGA